MKLKNCKRGTIVIFKKDTTTNLYDPLTNNYSKINIKKGTKGVIIDIYPTNNYSKINIIKGTEGKIIDVYPITNCVSISISLSSIKSAAIIHNITAQRPLDFKVVFMGIDDLKLHKE